MLFFGDYNRPGPGIDPDAGRTTGIARIWEMISRDYVSFWLAGILNVLTSLPLIFLIAYAFMTHSILIAVIGGAFGGVIAAPCFYGLADTLLRSLRDEPGYWWNRYSKALRNNWKKTMVPGLICGIIVSLQQFILIHLLTLKMGLGMFICQMISMLVFLGIFLWALAQHALLELTFGALLKNSVILAVRYIGKTIRAAGIALLYILMMLMMFPGSVFLLVTAGFWLPLLCCFQIIYPSVDKTFNIEKELADRNKSSFRKETG